MLIGPLHQLRSRSGIHGPVFPVGHDIDCTALHDSPRRVMGPCLRRGTSMNERHNNQTRSFSTSASVVPSSEGLAATLMPAASLAAILLAATPLTPDHIPPAWPLQRPGNWERPHDGE